MTGNARRASLRQSPTEHAFVQDPYGFYGRVHDLGGTFYWEDYGFWCFAGHADVNRHLRNRFLGREILHVATREELGWAPVPDHLRPFYAFEEHSLLESEPPRHTRLRRLINRVFTQRAVAALRPGIETLAHSLVDRFEVRVDLLATYATPIPLTVITELLGVPPNESDSLLGWSHDMVTMYQARRDHETEAKAVRATIEFSDFIKEVIAARRRRPGNHLIDSLIAAEHAGDRLSNDELVSTCILLLNAGHEATVHAIGNGIKAVLEHGADRRVFASGSAACAVDELLRFDAPLHLFTRFVLRDLDWNGRRFRKGDTVGLLLGAANHDPRVFPGPDRLDLGRRNASAHASFGSGIHACVGAPLARLEIQVALSVLFSRLPSLALDEIPRYANRYHFRGLNRLVVRTR